MFLFRLHQNLRRRNQVPRPNTVSPQLLTLMSHELCDVVLVNCTAPLGTAAVASRRVPLTELKHKCGVSFSVYRAFDFPGNKPEMKKAQACRHQRVEFARWADVAIIGRFHSGSSRHHLSTMAWHQCCQHGMVGRSGKV